MLIKTVISICLIFNLLYPCAVCYGNPEDAMTKGMNMGILTLMGFIGFVLIIIAYSIFSLFLKTKKINNS